MNSALISIVAFIVAIGVLVTVHEYGHFLAARRLGIRVLRFSIGFGKPLWVRAFGADRTELAIAVIPLGGYVKMLDEREGEVPVEERHRAFNTQPVLNRIAVVTAGPLFNFLFAILVYWAMFVSGVPGMRPVVGSVDPGSHAALAGINTGDELLAVNDTPTPTWQAAVLSLLDAGLGETQAIGITVRNDAGVVRRLQARFESADDLLQKGSVLENFGLHPWQPPAVIDHLTAGGAGERAGLRSGDRIVHADSTAISSWSQWVDYVRARPAQVIAVQVLRDGRMVDVELKPVPVIEDGETIGRIGAYVRLPTEEQRATMRVVVRYGPLGAVPEALKKTWEITTLTLRTLWMMVTGRASVENLSGPISIAQYAGQSAAIGMAAFLGFLGIVSVSLGVLNLLPVPVLDGGHLMYYIVELLKGSPLSDAAQQLGQKIGIALLLALMTVAFYNDLVRLLD